jgi:CysZ protein
MLSAALRAFGDLISPEFRSVLFKAVGLALALFIIVLVAVETAIFLLTLLPWPWAETMLAIGTGLALLVAFFFLMAPVTAIFAGLYLDEIALRVELRHYPDDRPGVPLTMPRSIIIATQFALVVLAVNLAVLPLVFTGIGALALIAANAYLIGREYFQMVAMRHMPAVEARQLRKEHTPRIFLASILPALLAVVPIVNLAVPLFATSYFVHLFKQVRASSA